MDEGWCLYNQAIETDGFLLFSGIKRDGKGYVKQETDKLMKMVVFK